MPNLHATNLHATGVVLGDRGLLITGPSGSGKTTLALALVERASEIGLFSAFIADDQSLIAARNGRLVCHAPLEIAGLAEVFGLGPRAIQHSPAAMIDLVVDLAPQTERFPAPQEVQLEGISLPILRLPQRNMLQSRLAIAAWLGWPPVQK